MNLIEAGLTPDLAISSMNLTPVSKSWKRMEPNFLTSGRDRTFNTASVITPKLPSLPRTNCLKSGPLETLGQLPFYVNTP
jgi:hypothetical protein